MFFDKCTNIGELQAMRQKLMTQLTKEYAETREKLLHAHEVVPVIEVFKTPASLPKKPPVYAAFMISQEPVPVNKLVIDAKGWVAM